MWGMELLKKLRQEAGLTQKAAGEPRFSKQAVAVYEKESAELMQIRYLIQLRRKCRVSWEEFGSRLDEIEKEKKEDENEGSNS